MRGARGILSTAGVVALSWAVAASLSARSLEGAPARGPVPLDAGSSLAEALALLVTALAFVALGRAEAARHASPPRSGALAGLLGGAVAATAQAAGIRAYLGATLSRYALPDGAAEVALVLYVVVATLAFVAIGAGVAWWGGRLARA